MFRLTVNILLIFSTLNFTISQQRIPKIVFVIADGIPAVLIEKSATPNLNAIVAKGMYKRAFIGGIKNA